MFYPIDLTKAKQGKTTKLFTIPLTSEQKYFNKLVGRVFYTIHLVFVFYYCYFLMTILPTNTIKQTWKFFCHILKNVVCITIKNV